MTLRTRISAVAATAVALAVIGAAVILYVAVRSDLRGQVDESLEHRADTLLGVAGGEAVYLARPTTSGRSGESGEQRVLRLQRQEHRVPTAEC